MRITVFSFLLATASLFCALNAAAQGFPRIWVNDNDKARILDNIEKYPWAKDLKKQLEERVDPWSTRHKRNPEYLLSRIPKTWGNATNYTDADLTQKNSSRPYLTSGKAPIPTLHRSDDYIPKAAGDKRYVYPGIEGMKPYNDDPYYGMELTVDNTTRKEFVPYIARFLRNVHNDILTLGVDAATLYYITNNEDYAQLAADILYAYIEPLVYMNPSLSSRPHADGIIITNFLRDARITLPMFPLMYDMVHPFLQKNNTRVFDAVSKTRKNFNDGNAQKVFIKLADLVLNKGITESNWSILEGSAVLFNIIAVKDKRERDRLFKAFYNDGTRRHDAFSFSLNFYTPENLWPEPLGYSFDVARRMTMMIEIIDRNEELFNLDMFNLYPGFLEGAFVYENLTYPTEEKLRFGDASRTAEPVEEIYQLVLAVAERKGLTNYRNIAEGAIANVYKKRDGYKPSIASDSLGYEGPLQLLWGVNFDLNKAKAPKKDSAVYLSHANIIMQRNYNTPNTVDHGLMYYTGGGTYVHAHASGIDMELYGAGKVMANDFGWGQYGTALHDNYATKHAAHNTVIVNNFAKQGELVSGNPWNTVMDKTELLAAEPASFKTPLSRDFSFSCKKLDDNINDADHQRCIAMVRTADTAGYYVDFSRAKSKGQDRHSDYLYHNMGDRTTIKTMAGANVSLGNTPNRYQNDIGDDKQQPGWRYFEDTKTTSATDDTLKVQFHLDAINRSMIAYLPGGDGNREVSLALGPQMRDAGDGYDRVKTQIMTIRRQGEAWKRPYVVVYEPSTTNNSTITSTELIRQNSEVVGVEVISNVGGDTIKDTIISHDQANQTFTRGDITFTGRFAIVRERTSGANSVTELYIGDGQSLTYKDTTLTGGDKRQNYKVAGDLAAPAELALQGFSYAADEKQLLEVTRPVDIAYGAEGNFIFRTNRRTNVMCENSICTKDPAPSVKKACYTRESKTSYNERLTSIPGTLEAEHYDYGGFEVSYFDSSPEVNKGAQESGVRPNEGMDIAAAPSGAALAWIGDGEWVEYTVYVHEAGQYTLNFMAATANASTKQGRIEVAIDGMPAIAGVALPSTSGANDFKTSTANLELAKGEQVLRLTFLEGGIHLDKVVFERAAQ